MGEITANHIGELGVRADFAMGANDSLPLQHGAREKDGILAYHHVLLYVSVFRVNDRNAGRHELFRLAEAKNTVRLGKLDAGIDAHGFISIVSCHGNDLEARFDHDFKNVGQVIFALCVFVINFRKRIG